MQLPDLDVRRPWRCCNVTGPMQLMTRELRNFLICANIRAELIVMLGGDRW